MSTLAFVPVPGPLMSEKVEPMGWLCHQLVLQVLQGVVDDQEEPTEWGARNAAVNRLALVCRDWHQIVTEPANVQRRVTVRRGAQLPLSSAWWVHVTIVADSNFEVMDVAAVP